jgi:hypothetical protein
MKVNNYPLKTPSAGDKLFGSDVNGDQKQFDMSAVSNNVFQYEIGKYVADQGGVIFHRYLDGGTQNYLVVGLNNLSAAQTWSNVTSTLIGSTAQSTWDGLSNSIAIVNQSGQISSAAKLCLDSTANGQIDWYLPSNDELNILFNQRFLINQELIQIPASQGLFGFGYWGSTESTSTNSFIMNGGVCVLATEVKSAALYVRAIRKFSI